MGSKLGKLAWVQRTWPLCGVKDPKHQTSVLYNLPSKPWTEIPCDGQIMPTQQKLDQGSDSWPGFNKHKPCVVSRIQNTQIPRGPTSHQSLGRIVQPVKYLALAMGNQCQVPLQTSYAFKNIQSIVYNTFYKTAFRALQKPIWALKSRAFKICILKCMGKIVDVEFQGLIWMPTIESYPYIERYIFHAMIKIWD